MNPTNRSDVEQFFRNQPLYKMATTIEEIKSNFKIFQDYDISDEVLTVHYMINEQDEMSEYPYNQFEAWVGQNAKYGLIWVYPEPTQYVSSPLPYALEVWQYIEENETALVKEFYNANK